MYLTALLIPVRNVLLALVTGVNDSARRNLDLNLQTGPTYLHVLPSSGLSLKLNGIGDTYHILTFATLLGKPSLFSSICLFKPRVLNKLICVLLDRKQKETQNKAVQYLPESRRVMSKEEEKTTLIYDRQNKGRRLVLLGRRKITYSRNSKAE